MTTKGELAELVMDHLARNASPANAALASVMSGLARIFTAYNDAQERGGNWRSTLENLRTGVQLVEAALPLLRTDGGAGVATVIEMAEREVEFARVVEEGIGRMTAGESTLV
jgi:hypothetical protein